MRSSVGVRTPGTTGRVLHGAAARFYDLTAWLFLGGGERAFRERLARLADIRAGDRVLDVGCGTGSLAIEATRHVGAAGTVHGIDASPEMIARARAKAGRDGADVRFDVAVIESLPFGDASFDVVFATLMLHHLPRPARALGAREIRRVLKPGGRILAVDFARSSRHGHGLLARVHRHGHVALHDIVALLNEAGLTVIDNGDVGVRDLQFALAAAPDDS